MRNLFLIPIIFSFCSQIISQNNTFGFRAGLSVSSLAIKNVDEHKSKWGYNVSVFTEQKIDGVLFIAPELSICTKGAVLQSADNNFNAIKSVNLNYLECLLPFVYKFNTIDLQVGPFLSYMIGASTVVQKNTTLVINDIDKNQYNNIDAGFLVGFNFNLSKKFSLGARYTQGLMQIVRNNNYNSLFTEAKNAVSQINMSYKF